MQQSRNQLIDPVHVLTELGISAGHTFADLGCGALGHFVFPAAERIGAGGMVYAVDIDKTALNSIERIAKQRQLYHIQALWSDIDIVGATRIPEGSIDLTLIANNLYLSSDRQGLIHEAIRLTKTLGQICVIEWRPDAGKIGPPVDARMSESEVKALFLTTNSSFVKRFDAGDEHYALVFRKDRVLSSDAVPVSVPAFQFTPSV